MRNGRRVLIGCCGLTALVMVLLATALGAGWRGITGTRTVLTDTLERHEMPASEYLWTGLALTRAREHLEEPAGSGVPEANLMLARRYRGRLAPVADARESGRARLNAVLGAAAMLARIEGTTFQFEGSDSL